MLNDANRFLNQPLQGEVVFIFKLYEINKKHCRLNDEYLSPIFCNQIDPSLVFPVAGNFRIIFVGDTLLARLNRNLCSTSSYNCTGYSKHSVLKSLLLNQQLRTGATVKNPPAIYYLTALPCFFTIYLSHLPLIQLVVFMYTIRSNHSVIYRGVLF